MSPVTFERPIGIYYEHPHWFEPLFAELDRRGVPYERLHAGEHFYEANGSVAPYSLLLNRMSPSADLRGYGSAILYTLQYLRHLKELGTRVINGYDAFAVETSKALQLSLLQRLGLPYPRTRVIHDPAEAPQAARALRFPIVLKPNIGGSGAGIRCFRSPDELRRAVAADEIGLGLDHTGLVQERIPADGDSIVRVEVLGGRFLYAIRVHTTGDTFNLCPADICRDVDGRELAGATCVADAEPDDLWVEGYTPAPEIVAAVERVMAAAGIEVGGIEYLTDARDGRIYFYDINALSNFVADAPRVVGFDPFQRLADYLEQEAS